MEHMACPILWKQDDLARKVAILQQSVGFGAFMQRKGRDRRRGDRAVAQGCEQPIDTALPAFGAVEIGPQVTPTTLLEPSINRSGSIVGGVPPALPKITARPPGRRAAMLSCNVVPIES